MKYETLVIDYRNSSLIKFNVLKYFYSKLQLLVELGVVVLVLCIVHQHAGLCRDISNDGGMLRVHSHGG